MLFDENDTSDWQHSIHEIDKACIPKGTKIETEDDETDVRSRIVVQQFNVVKRDEVHQGTPLLRVLRVLLALVTSKGASAWRSFILPWMSSR